MGESDTRPYETLLVEARERFDAAEDLTVSVEEEFALLDPESLDLVNRFEDVHAAARGVGGNSDAAIEPLRLLGAEDIGLVSSGPTTDWYAVPMRSRADRNQSAGVTAAPLVLLPLWEKATRGAG